MASGWTQPQQPQTCCNPSSGCVSTTGSPQPAWEPRSCSRSLGKALATGDATPPVLPAWPTEMREGKNKSNQSLKDASRAEHLQGCLWVPSRDAPASCISLLLHHGEGCSHSQVAPKGTKLPNDAERWSAAEPGANLSLRTLHWSPCTAYSSAFCFWEDRFPACVSLWVFTARAAPPSRQTSALQKGTRHQNKHPAPNARLKGDIPHAAPSPRLQHSPPTTLCSSSCSWDTICGLFSHTVREGDGAWGCQPQGAPLHPHRSPSGHHSPCSLSLPGSLPCTRLERHHQLGNLPKYSSYQVTGKSLLLLMLLMENFSPFSAAFKASLVSHRLCLARRRRSWRHRGGARGWWGAGNEKQGGLLPLPPSPPASPAPGRPGSSPYLPHLLTAQPPPPPQGSCPAPQEARRMHSEA